MPAGLCCVTVLFKALCCEMKNVFFIFLCLFFVSLFLCEKYHMPITVQYWLAGRLGGKCSYLVTLVNELDLQMPSLEMASCSYVGNESDGLSFLRTWAIQEQAICDLRRKCIWCSNSPIYIPNCTLYLVTWKATWKKAVCFCSVAQVCPTLCDPWHARPPCPHCLSELTQVHGHCINDAVHCRSPTPAASDSTWRDERCRRLRQLAFSSGLPVYSKFKYSFLYFYKNMRPEVWHFRFPLSQIYYLP